MTELESGNERLNHSKIGFKETETELSGLKTNTKVNKLKGEIKENTNAGKIIDTNVSRNGYKIYSYTVKKWAFPIAIKRETIQQLKLKKINGIKITNYNGVEYNELHKFKKGEKIYVKVPIKEEHHESENEIIDGIKCKGGEYLGIDLSSHNKDFNRSNFKNWNRENRDSKDRKRKGISFSYIRTSDDIKRDPLISTYVTEINKYNKDKKVKENHEQIKIGFYHRLSGSDPIKQAELFVQQRKTYKSSMIPMIDVEDGLPKGGRVSTAYKNKNYEIVRNNTYKRLNYVEKYTGVKPGIYMGENNYNFFMKNDPQKRFTKYKTRLANYNKKSSGDMQQTTDKGTAGGFPKVDENKTKNIKQFLI